MPVKYEEGSPCVSGASVMKKERSVQTKVGIFVLASLAIFVYGVFTISGQDELFEKEHTVRTYFENTAGLLEGAYVRLSGVGVGTVSSIRFSDDPDLGKVQVVISVHRKALDLISPDSLATIRTEGLLGAKYVEIIPGEGPGLGLEGDGSVIRGYTSPEMQQIISQSEELISNLTSISRDLNKIVHSFSDEKFSSDVSALFSNLASISESISQGEGTLGALIVDPSVHDALKGVLGEAQRNRFVRSAVRYMLDEREKRALRERGGDAGSD